MTVLGANRPLRVHRWTPGEPDEYGDLAPSWTEGEWVTGNLFTLRSNELVDGVVTTSRELRCLLPAGTVVGARDLVETEDGHRYRVVTAQHRRIWTGQVWHTTCELAEDGIDAV